MITYSLWSALIIYYFIMFATPGPNNAMLTASGMKFGYLRTLPHIIGIPLGHFIQITLVCYGLGNVFIKFPQIQFYMKFLCFVYLLYLSWKMLGSISVTKKEIICMLFNFVTNICFMHLFLCFVFIHLFFVH